jgi:4-hydroxybenzoyl-CoA thioesterase
METASSSLDLLHVRPRSKTTVFEVSVMFGDCDPAGIVFFPNFLKWMDASSHHFFIQCGLPPFRELEKARGIVGHPLLEISTRFKRPATYGDRLQVRTSVVEWGRKTFVHQHEVWRDDLLLCEGTETRTFVVRHPEDSQRIISILVPEDIIQKCTETV